VSLVKPPNITIPKTLTALPSNQYATVFEDVSGKKDVFTGAFTAGRLFPIFCPSDPSGVFEVSFANSSGVATVVLFHRILFLTAIDRGKKEAVVTLLDCLTHW
jgi:hypothetical protein